MSRLALNWIGFRGSGRDYDFRECPIDIIPEKGDRSRAIPPPALFGYHDELSLGTAPRGGIDINSLI